MTNYKTLKSVMDKINRHGQKASDTTPNATVATIIYTGWTRPPSTRKQVMDTRKDASMQAHLKKSDQTAPPTPPTGKVAIHAVREGLAMVMDGLRVMDAAGAKVSKASILFDGKICLLPVIEITGYMLGISVMDDGSLVFTTNGVSVMDAMTVMDNEPMESANDTQT